MTMQKEKAVSIRGPEHSTLFWAFGTVCIYIYIYIFNFPPRKRNFLGKVLRKKDRRRRTQSETGCTEHRKKRRCTGSDTYPWTHSG